MPKSTRFLFFGAGVIGSLQAAKLALSGQDVTVLARGERLEQIREQGLAIEEMRTGKRETVRVRVTDRLGDEEGYDFIVVCVRANQVGGVLPLLSDAGSGSVVFMVNRALGYEEYTAALGRERVLAGFPAAAGTLEDGVVRYYVPSGLARLAQSTTFGELDGSWSERVRQLALLFGRAGFPSAISGNMDAWQKSHVVVVGCIGAAIYLHAGSNYELARSKQGVRLMIDGIRQGFRVLRSLGYPVTPPKLCLLERMPVRILTPLFQRLLATELAEIVIAFHTRAAKDEMGALAEELQVLIERAGLPTPAIDELNRCYLQ